MRHLTVSPSRSSLAALLLGGAVLALSALVAAQDTPTEQAAPQQPVFAGRDRASGQVSNALGARFELGNFSTLVLPAGNRISSAQTFTFSLSRTPFRPRDVLEGFARQGAVMAFSGQIDASRAPVEVSIRQRTLTPRPNMKLVLAMEIAGICDATHTLRLLGPLCSHWRTLDARHDPATSRIVAQLPAPGGYRLVFGWIPDAQPALVDPASL
jgi:hypothetical protein